MSLAVSHAIFGERSGTRRRYFERGFPFLGNVDQAGKSDVFWWKNESWVEDILEKVGKLKPEARSFRLEGGFRGVFAEDNWLLQGNKCAYMGQGMLEVAHLISVE